MENDVTKQIKSYINEYLNDANLDEICTKLNIDEYKIAFIFRDFLEYHGYKDAVIQLIIE